MANKKSIFFLLAGIILISLISGCTGTSQPTRFYTLTATEKDQVLQEKSSRTSDLSIGIGPLKLADYLTQTRIVTRIDDNKIDRAEFDQWSGALKNNVINVLADNIGSLLNTEKIVLYPWRSYIPIDFQIEIEVTRFDGQPGQTATLEARWIVLTGEDKTIVDMQRSTIKESMAGSDYEAMVAAQSRALGRLSADIAKSVDAATIK